MIRKTMLGLSISAAAMAQTAFADEAAGEGAAPADEIVVTGRVSKLYRVEETASGKMPTEPWPPRSRSRSSHPS